MLVIDEAEKFVAACSLYEQVGSITIDEAEMIDQIMELGESNEYSAINTLFNDEDHDTAALLFEELFGMDFESLNDLADEYGYQRISDDVL